MILYSKWLDLPISTRIKIASEFGIVKKGSTEVFNDTIKSDGYVLKEIEAALCLENLQKFVDEPEEKDIVLLWNFMLNKINGIPKVKPSMPITIIPEEQVKIEPLVKEESELSRVIKANAKPKKKKNV